MNHLEKGTQYRLIEINFRINNNLEVNITNKYLFLHLKYIKHRNQCCNFNKSEFIYLCKLIYINPVFILQLKNKIYHKDIHNQIDLILKPYFNNISNSLIINNIKNNNLNMVNKNHYYLKNNLLNTNKKEVKYLDLNN